MEFKRKSSSWEKREAVEINQKIDKLLFGIHSAFDTLVEREKTN